MRVDYASCMPAIASHAAQAARKFTAPLCAARPPSSRKSRPNRPSETLNAYGETGPLCRVIVRVTVNRIHYKGSGNQGDGVVHKPVCACA